ncbi:MAG: PA14 domain-containing protein [Gemmataceae bacterium]
MTDVFRMSMWHIRAGAAAIAMLSFLSGATFAGEKKTSDSAHPIVSCFERYYNDPNSDSFDGGRLLLGELNCTSCHATSATAAKWISAKKAPILTDVGSRVRPSYLRKYLTAPHKTKPGTAMPDVFAGLPPAERKEKVEALVHLLASTGTIGDTPIRRGYIAQGKAIFHQIGCVACHGPIDKKGVNDPSLMPLLDLESKYTIPSLTAFLNNPHAVRPSARMPGLVQGKQAELVAHYLLKNLPAPPPTVKFAYYHGSWNNLPNFKSLKPLTVGTAVGIDVKEVIQRNSQFGIVFNSYLKIQKTGNYRFRLTSDDGSRLRINGRDVVVNDGTHAMQTRLGTTKLEKGLHPVEIQFFNQGGPFGLNVDVEGPGVSRRGIGALLTLKEKKKPRKETGEDDFRVNAQFAAKGKMVFTSSGCASCHQLEYRGQVLQSTFRAPELANLEGKGGCLTNTPKKGVPHFGLNSRQQTVLAKSIKEIARTTKVPSTKHIIAHTMSSLNCYACHERDNKGGPLTAIESYFKTPTPEIGDEGRIPPKLDLVGAKLKTEYFKQIMDKGANDRPYMLTQMPRYGLETTGHLVKHFPAVDTLKSVKPVDFHVPLRDVQAAGRKLVGLRGLQCIQCHTFAGKKAKGIQGIDMTLMPKRVRRDWFAQYLINPNEFRKGTRMPTFWPNGKSQLKTILKGDTDKQVEAIWVYLKRAPRGGYPIGIGSDFLELIPIKEAIIYRNFIQGAGPRAIGVGYPELAHLAFDANDLRIAMLWQGAFMDASRHWKGRGQGFQPPLGDKVLKLYDGPSVAVLAEKNTPWPGNATRKAGYKFLGYNLTADQRPTFRYSLGSIVVEDFPNAVEKNLRSSLKRTVTLTAKDAPKKVFFRAAVAAKIEPQEKGVYLIDGTWKTRIESTSDPIIRQAGGSKELLVPVTFQNNTAKIVQDYLW